MQKIGLPRGRISLYECLHIVQTGEQIRATIALLFYFASYYEKNISLEMYSTSQPGYNFIYISSQADLYLFAINYQLHPRLIANYYIVHHGVIGIRFMSNLILIATNF